MSRDPDSPRCNDRSTIFLSYARGDDEAFVRRLYEDLAADFDVWYDRVNMPSRGLAFPQELREAIESSERFLIVVGPNAVTSSWCQAEWRHADVFGRPITPLIRMNGRSSDDLPIDGFDLIPKELKLQELHANDFRRDEIYDENLRRLVWQLRQPVVWPGRLVGVPDLPIHLLPRPDLVQSLRTELLSDFKRPVSITGVQGMGGIGKSVLANLVARDPGIRRAFHDGVFWIPIGAAPQLRRRQNELAYALGYKGHEFTSIEEGRFRLSEILATQSVLLVLDNVWNRESTEAFRVLGPKGRTILTTRDSGLVASVGGRHHQLELLTTTESLHVLAEASCVRPENLPKRAQAIVRRCGHLPLALALSGSLVRHGMTWETVLRGLEQRDFDRIDDPHPDPDNLHQRSIASVLRLSIDALPVVERSRFLELSVFPEDKDVPDAAARALWAHTANHSDFVTERLLLRLRERSLLLPSKVGTFAFHELVHAFARTLAGNRETLHRQLLDAYRARCGEGEASGWSTGPNDGYFFEHLARHLLGAGRREELEILLADFEFLKAKIDAVGPLRLIEDYEMLRPNCPDSLERIQEAVKLSADVVEQDSAQLGCQLHGRLSNDQTPLIRQLLDGTRRHSGCWLRPVTASLTLPGGPLKRLLRTHTGWINGLAVTSDGRWALSRERNGTLLLWDLDNGTELYRVDGYQRDVRNFVVTPDARHAVLASHDRSLTVVDLCSGTEVHRLWQYDWGSRVILWPHEGSVQVHAVTPDGRYAISSHAHSLKVWNLSTGSLAHTLSCEDWIVGAIVTCDSRVVISGCSGGAVQAWELTHGALIHTLVGHDQMISGIAATSDSRYLVSSSLDKTIRLWDLRCGTAVRTLTNPEHWRIRAVTSDSTAVATSDLGDLVVLDLDTGEPLQKLRTHGRGPLPEVTPNGSCAVSGSEHGVVRVWDLETDLSSYIEPRHEGAVGWIKVIANGKYTITMGAFDKTLQVWETRRAASLYSIPFPRDGHSLPFASSDDTPYVIWKADESSLAVYDISERSIVSTVSDLGAKVSRIAIIPPGSRAVVGLYDGTLQIRELQTDAVVSSFRAQAGEIRDLIVTRSLKYLLGIWFEGVLRIWNLENGSLVRTIRTSESLLSVATTPDDRYAVACTGKTLEIWDIHRGSLVHKIPAHTAWAHGLVVTRDGTRAVSRSEDGTMKVWDLRSGTLLHTLSHRAFVRQMTVTSDDRYTISASLDCTLRLWNLVTGEALATFHADSEVWCCAATPSYSTLVAGDYSGQVHFLRIENQRDSNVHLARKRPKGLRT